ncbi:hypothetical protein SESBI_02686 [Sesbania bispinosa]|nr:hypothetical protein SESBI_02686 [Sesbania bispinosa]
MVDHHRVPPNRNSNDSSMVVIHDDDDKKKNKEEDYSVFPLVTTKTSMSSQITTPHNHPLLLHPCPRFRRLIVTRGTSPRRSILRSRRGAIWSFGALITSCWIVMVIMVRKKKKNRRLTPNETRLMNIIKEKDGDRKPLSALHCKWIG